MKSFWTFQCPEYSKKPRSTPWLLTPWLLVSPGHQQPWYWQCSIWGPFLSMWNDFKYLHCLHVSNWCKTHLCFVFPENYSTCNRLKHKCMSDIQCSKPHDALILEHPWASGLDSGFQSLLSIQRDNTIWPSGTKLKWHFNPSAPVRCGCDIKLVIFKLISRRNCWFGARQQ